MDTSSQSSEARKQWPHRGPAQASPEFSDIAEHDRGFSNGRRRTSLRLTFRSKLPSGAWGRAAASLALVFVISVAGIAAEIARRMISRDERFVLAGSSSIITEGNRHLSRGQILEVFAGDLERNILRMPLEVRKTDLEMIPWVERTTLMRLLPDRISVAIEERIPIAYVRQGGHIELIDANGVLLEVGSRANQADVYSFPVVTGLSFADPLSVRAARMKIFQDFLREIDTDGEKVSMKVSEVDLSNPEDVKALIPDHGADVLVHFGDSNYLDRYQKYETHLAEWRVQYPRLSSVDMRYERQVILEMQPGTDVPVSAAMVQGLKQLPDGGVAVNVPKGASSTKVHATSKVTSYFGRRGKTLPKAGQH